MGENTDFFEKHWSRFTRKNKSISHTNFEIVTLEIHIQKIEPG